MSIIQHELDSISPPAVQCFVDYYNSSRGFTPCRQPCQQWNQLRIYSPVKIKTWSWWWVILMSMCVSGLISGEPFYFICCFPKALLIWSRFDWSYFILSLVLWVFLSKHSPEFDVNQETQDCLNEHKFSVVGSVFSLRQICFFHSHTFVGKATAIYSVMGVNWWCQMW